MGSTASAIIYLMVSMMGDTGLAVLGLERGGMSQEVVLTVLAKQKEAGNITEEQVQKLAVDTQVCIARS